MTYGEIKDKIRDLGFEENSTMVEYQSIVANAVNRAVSVIYHTLVYPNRNYYLHNFGEEVDEPQIIDVSTKDEDTIFLPNNTLEMIPLLASYYVWLDDDIVKATMYKNEFEDIKENLIGMMNTRPKLIFGEGLGF